MQDNHEEKIDHALKVLWASGLPVTYSTVVSVDETGTVVALYKLSSERLRDADLASHSQSAVIDHLLTLIKGKLVVAKLLDKDIVIAPSDVLEVKKELKEKLNLDLDMTNSYLIDESDYENKGYVSCGIKPVIAIQANGIKGLVDIYDALNARNIGLLSVSFTNVSPDELKATLDES